MYSSTRYIFGSIAAEFQSWSCWSTLDVQTVNLIRLSNELRFCYYENWYSTVAGLAIEMYFVKLCDRISSIMLSDISTKPQDCPVAGCTQYWSFCYLDPFRLFCCLQVEWFLIFSFPSNRMRCQEIGHLSFIHFLPLRFLIFFSGGSSLQFRPMVQPAARSFIDYPATQWNVCVCALAFSLAFALCLIQSRCD